MTTTRDSTEVFLQAISEVYGAVSKQTHSVAISHEKIWWQIIKHFWAILDRRGPHYPLLSPTIPLYILMDFL